FNHQRHREVNDGFRHRFLRFSKSNQVVVFDTGTSLPDGMQAAITEIDAVAIAWGSTHFPVPSSS
ncbi:MAG: hypothetical protein VKK04_10450, partial [Synechococcales bacterium]|nr:hypothetical protein [Synechococcales bacterium]